TAAVAALATWVTTADDFAAAAGGAGMGWRVLTTTALVVLYGLSITPLWRQRASVLDLWLLITLTAWVLDVLLRRVAADESSFTCHCAGFSGLLGMACMTLALLSETARLYSRLMPLVALRGGGVRKAPAPVADAALESLANELNQPLCAITANADAID